MGMNVTSTQHTWLDRSITNLRSRYGMLWSQPQCVIAATSAGFSSVLNSAALLLLFGVTMGRGSGLTII